MVERFTDHHDYRAEEQEITVREDAPQELRFAIPEIARNLDMSPKEMRNVVCGTLLVPPDQNNWSHDRIWDEVKRLIDNCHWAKVYDIAEAFHAAFRSDRNEIFENRLNQFFRENGIGWQMTEGKIRYRGSETFAEITHKARKVLAQAGRSAAENEIHEALQDISRRPPDITGAVQHAIAALECTARGDGQAKPDPW